MVDPIIEKIKKLLRMKRGGTAGEIENALAMAAELARKHGIDLGSVDPDAPDAKPITHVADALKLRITAEEKYAAAILVNFFNVQICMTPAINLYILKRPAKITFIGTDWDCQIARYVYIFLRDHFRRSWNRRENRRLKNRNAFLNGMFLGLAAKLEEARRKEPGVGLIAVDRALQLRKEYLARLFPNATDKKIDEDNSGADASKYAGIIAGQKTEIRSGLNKAEEPKRAALPAPAAWPKSKPGQIALL